MPRRVTLELVKQVQNLVQRGYCTREIGRRTGLSMSAVYKIRQNRHRLTRADRPSVQQEGAVWCPRCRCRVYPPCLRCRLRQHQRSQMLLPRADAWRRRLPPVESFPPVLRARLEIPVAELGLPVRVVNYLEHAGILLVYDLLAHRPQELLAIPNFARKTLEQVYRALEPLGFVRRGVVRPGEPAPSARGPAAAQGSQSFSSPNSQAPPPPVSPAEPPPR